MENKYKNQFIYTSQEYFKNVSFLDWYRFFFIFKDLNNSESKNILEIGEGSGIIKNIFKEKVDSYLTMDLNKKLNPDFLNDVRNFLPDLERRFDCIVAAEVLEHIPFEDLEKALFNFYKYLKKDGMVIITIPHRASNFLFMTPTEVPHSFRIPTGFLSFGAFYRRFIKRKIWIDPGHEWEICDGKHLIRDVESKMIKSGFKIGKIKKLVYADYWILKK